MSKNTEAPLRWYALHTHPNQEGRAESNLTAWNIETFVPKYKVRRRNEFKSEPSYSVRPLFTGYIFARFDANEIPKVRYTRGVHSVVSVGTTPVHVDDDLIEAIKGRIGGDGLVKLSDEIKPGDDVVLKGGHFNNFEGVFERRLKDKERVMILLKTVTHRVRVVVPESLVMKSAPLP
ncbi:MAG TPA: transcription termination/antitermination NusG family protein [Pyrinomonadaceae bacterium]|jgi:transcription elongation factor/antiterminator RfaH|nr:transcription termination/antitermination NusG family protein [Pyrinomonadaceae bacterium]